VKKVKKLELKVDSFVVKNTRKTWKPLAKATWTVDSVVVAEVGEEATVVATAEAATVLVVEAVLLLQARLLSNHSLRTTPRRMYSAMGVTVVVFPDIGIGINFGVDENLLQRLETFLFFS
jgi:hypothetical protein